MAAVEGLLADIVAARRLIGRGVPAAALCRTLAPRMGSTAEELMLLVATYRGSSASPNTTERELLAEVYASRPEIMPRALLLREEREGAGKAAREAVLHELAAYGEDAGEPSDTVAELHARLARLREKELLPLIADRVGALARRWGMRFTTLRQQALQSVLGSFLGWARSSRWVRWLGPDTLLAVVLLVAEEE